MTYVYKCNICGKEYKNYREQSPSLRFCPECRKKPENKNLIKDAQDEVNRQKIRERQEWFKSHPEEYEEYKRNRKLKSEKTKIERYGSLEKAEQSRYFNQIETLKKKYPDEDWENITNIGQISKIKEKINNTIKSKDNEFFKKRHEKSIQTKIEKYGSLEEANKVMTNHQKETMIKNYGVESSLNLKQTRDALCEKLKDKDFLKRRKEKTEKTKIEKYGSLEEAYASMTKNLKNTLNKCDNDYYKAINKKRENTNLEKYGVSNYTKTDDYKKKSSNTWGNKRPDEIDDIVSKRNKTRIKKYGSLEESYSVASKNFKKNFLEKYGVDNPSKLPEIREKVENTILEKFGSWKNIKTNEQREKIKREIIESNLSKYREFDFNSYGLEYFEDNNKPYVRCKKCGFVDDITLPPSHLKNIRCYRCKPYYTTSSTETHISETLKSWGIDNIIRDNRKILGGKELDIYLPDYNLAIEYDGCYWHQYKEGKIEKDTHLIKTLECEKKGIYLIHIFDEEYINNEPLVFNVIKRKLNLLDRKLDSKECSVLEIDNQSYKDFMEKNNLQGYAPAKIRLGLFYGEELVASMSFSKSKYDKNYEYSLVRYCEKQDTVVINGIKKIFDYFVNTYSPNSIVSYCDYRWFRGSSYKELGFTFKERTVPSYKYFKPGYYRFMNKENFQKHKLKNMKDFKYYEDLTEIENMRVNGYSLIYDCGQLKLDWHPSHE